MRVVSDDNSSTSMNIGITTSIAIAISIIVACTIAATITTITTTDIGSEPETASSDSSSSPASIAAISAPSLAALALPWESLGTESKMTLTIFVNHSPLPSRQRDSHSHWLDYGGMQRAIGHEPTSRLSRTKVLRNRGFTPTSTAKEGDQSNVAYWYGRAGKAVSGESLGT